MGNLNNNNHQSCIQTRFGLVLSVYAKEIYFDKGLIGFSAFKDFLLIKNIFKNFSEFYLLQLAANPSFSLILKPIENKDFNNFFDQKLLNQIANELEINNSNLAVFLVANVKIIDGKQEIFVNNKAPIILDKGSNNAVQYIINGNKYKIKRKI